MIKYNPPRSTDKFMETYDKLRELYDTMYELALDLNVVRPNGYENVETIRSAPPTVPTPVHPNLQQSPSDATLSKLGLTRREWRGCGDGE